MQNYFDSATPPFISTDFHYFRLAREKWAFMLTRLTQMGVKMVTITVPWGFHAPNQDMYDLNGATNARRDVIGLIELCAALNLHCVLKPGPYARQSGILLDGLPHWLSADSMELNAELQKESTGWFKALSNALLKFQWPTGPIVALYLNDSSVEQPSPATYSKKLTEVRWPIWLRKRYRGMESLNEAYGSTYHSVSDVSFPQRWSKDPPPLEQDAKEFLAEVQGDAQGGYGHILLEAGWQIPIHPNTGATQLNLPQLQNHTLIDSTGLMALDPKTDNPILNLQHPIQVDPDPSDVGTAPVWAKNAPLKGDGSAQRTFWHVRQFLWTNSISGLNFEAPVLTFAEDGGGLVTSGQDTTLQIKLEKGTRPSVYRLSLSGEVTLAADIKAARARLKGPYLTASETPQTDLILYRNDSTAPLHGFLRAYLHTLLKGQTQTLVYCAAQTLELGQMLTPSQVSFDKESLPKAKKPSSYTLKEARRGLSEADRILRKTVAAIGGLEGGFETILGRGGHDPEPATPSLAISPEIFEGRAKDIMVKAGKLCRSLAPDLKSTATALQSSLDSEQSFTLAQYQQNYQQAVQCAQSTRDSLLEIITELRVELTTEELPLVIWRVHNQIQEITEGLRWGVLRG